MSALNFDIARQAAAKEFARRHPPVDWPDWPDWFGEVAVWGGSKDGRDGWLISLTAARRPPLEPGEFLEPIDGHDFVARIDPVSGKTLITISA